MNEVTAHNINSPHELDFLLKSLTTSEPINELRTETNNLQNFVNLSYNNFSPTLSFVQIRDQTPSPYYTYSPIIPSNHEQFPGNEYSSLSPDTFLLNRRRKRNAERPIDLDRSRIAQRRKRDENGKFLKKEVASKIEELEEKLRSKEEECNNLRQALSAKDEELNSLRNQLQNQSIINPSLLQQQNGLSSVPMLNLPSRNYVLIPNPNPQQIGTDLEREAFKEKIDYSKIQLRKTDSLLDVEKREVLLSQEQWEERHRLNEFLRKVEEQQRWYNFEFSEEAPVQNQTYLYGGPPSNIYSPPTKIGNLQVPAFTTKVDFSTKREELGKKEERKIEKKQYILVEQPHNMPTSPSRLKSSSPRPIRQVSPNKFHQLQHQYQASQLQNQYQTSQLQNQYQIQNIQPYPDLSSHLWDEGMDIDIASNQYRRHPLGGPPSNIYTPPSKIGNLPVNAFTQKIDFSEIELRKTDGRYSSSPPL